MASVKMDKGKMHGGGEVKSRLRHNDITKEMRAIAKKGNPHINLDRCHLNMNLYGGTYAERCAKYDQIVADVDSVQVVRKQKRKGSDVERVSVMKPRKDRVTGQLIEIPIPNEIPEERCSDFARDALAVLIDFCGEDRLISLDMHADEVHEYKDADTGEDRISMRHLQGVAATVNRKTGRFDSNTFFTRANLNKLNNEFRKICQEKYNCDFLTGEGKSDGRSMHEIKALSAAREITSAAEEQAMRVADGADWDAMQTRQKAREQAEKEAADILSQAEEEAARMREEARERAEEQRADILSGARAEAAEIRKAAEESASGLLANVRTVTAYKALYRPEDPEKGPEAIARYVDNVKTYASKMHADCLQKSLQNNTAIDNNIDKYDYKRGPGQGAAATPPAPDMDGGRKKSPQELAYEEKQRQRIRLAEDVQREAVEISDEERERQRETLKAIGLA